MFNKKTLSEKLRLYLVCGEGESCGPLMRKAEQALAGGVTAVQLRVKSWDSRDMFGAACQLQGLCRRFDALFIVNDRLDVALACGADGVHLGQNDLPIDAARKIAPADFIIGATANTRPDVLKAQKLGADYIGCGAAFTTATKHDVNVIGPAGIKDAVGQASVPCVAIGGITLENLRRLADCGCGGISLSSEIMSHPNPKRRTQELFKEINLFFKHADRQNEKGSL